MMFTHSAMPVETLRQKSRDIQTHIREVGVTGDRRDQLDRELAHLEFEIAYQLGHVAQLFGIPMPDIITTKSTAA